VLVELLEDGSGELFSSDGADDPLEGQLSL